MTHKPIAQQVPEFSHIVSPSQIGAVPLVLELVVPQAAADQLACRFGLEALADMQIRAQLVRQGVNVHLSGQVQAMVRYRCRVSDQVFSQPVMTAMDLLFCPPTAPTHLPEIELDAHDLDIEPLDPHGIDVGEAAAQTLGLGLDPWPRAPDADQQVARLGIDSEDQAARRRNPFSILQGGRNGS